MNARVVTSCALSVAILVGVGCSSRGASSAGPGAGGPIDAQDPAEPATPMSLADAGAEGASASDDAGVDVRGEGPSCRVCAAYDAPAATGTIGPAALNETSGLAASRVHPGVLYAHNDSGYGPVIFALSASGASLGELHLAGAQSADWEDMALGPCPQGSCIYVGDTGDNGSNRPEPYVIYRVAEPNVAAPFGAIDVAFEHVEYTYPNGERHDCETLLVHPKTGDVYVVTKMGLGQTSAAYKMPQPIPWGRSAVLVKVADLAVPALFDMPITGGDIHPCGSALLLRAYNTVYQFAAPPTGPFDAIFTSPFTKVPASSQEIQGEAVAWLPSGLGYVTASEGANAALHSVTCR